MILQKIYAEDFISSITYFHMEKASTKLSVFKDSGNFFFHFEELLENKLQKVKMIKRHHHRSGVYY